MLKALKIGSALNAASFSKSSGSRRAGVRYRLVDVKHHGGIALDGLHSLGRK